MFESYVRYFILGGDLLVVGTLSVLLVRYIPKRHVVRRSVWPYKSRFQKVTPVLVYWFFAVLFSCGLLMNLVNAASIMTGTRLILTAGELSPEVLRVVKWLAQNFYKIGWATAAFYAVLFGYEKYIDPMIGAVSGEGLLMAAVGSLVAVVAASPLYCLQII